MNNIAGVKDRALLFGWAALILFIIILLWALTQPLKKYYLFRTVNLVLVSLEDERRVLNSYGHLTARNGLLGYWFTMNTQEYMFVFTVFQDGILVPVGAVVSHNGYVSELIPLGAHAVQVFDKLPQAVLQIYIRRIELAFNRQMQGGNS